MKNVKKVDKVIFIGVDNKQFTYGKEYMCSKTSYLDEDIFVVNNYGVWLRCDKINFYSYQEFREMKLKKLLNE